jgi:CheY-like chemotaxis protein
MKNGLKILVAEDDKGHFVLVKKNLWRSCVNSEIIHFVDGQQILDFLFEKNQNSLQPGNAYLILLDIRMPKVDGLEVLKKVKNDPELKKIPIIMLTTTDDPEEIRKCYEAGCSFYIVKPSNYNDFMNCVEQLGTFISLNNVKIPVISKTTSPAK